MEPIIDEETGSPIIDEETGKPYVYKIEEGEAFEETVYGKNIGSRQDAKEVVIEKSKTDEGKKVLPTVPK